MFAAAEDLDLLDSQLTPSFNIITQIYLTKSTDTQNASFLPISWCHGSYVKHKYNFLTTRVAKIFQTLYSVTRIIQNIVLNIHR